MYEDTQSSSNEEEIRALREEVKRTKSQRNELDAKYREMERQMKIISGERDSYEKRLREEGLL